MDRPILMSAPMVRALLSGTKTQTRRVIKPQPTHFNPAGVPRRARPDRSPSDVVRCPYGKPGDRLWLRETHAFSVVDPEGRDWRDDPDNWDVIYRADDKQPSGGWRDADGNVIAAPWRPSIHMPRWASRITLEITDVRVQRLHSISETNAYAEGVDTTGEAYAAAEHGSIGGASGPAPSVCAYAALWESINGLGSWSANPWVWAISFRRLIP